MHSSSNSILDYNTSQNLFEHFNEQVSELKGFMLLASKNGTRKNIETMSEIASRVRNLQYAISEMREHLSTERQSLNKVEELQNLAQKQHEYISHMEQKLPHRLPGKQELELEKQREIQQAKQQQQQQQNEQQRQPLSSRNTNTPSKPNVSKNGKARTPSNSTIKKGNKKRSKSRIRRRFDESEIPNIQYLSKAELHEIPQYMRGRLTISKINPVIDDIRKVVVDKYRLLSKPTAQLNDKQMKIVRKYYNTDTSETDGKFYFVESDLKGCSSCKQISTVRNILTILRHTGRISTVRDGSVIRFVL
eukprot:gb/GECH01006455.1/.p1 GENE.gb/GECH01006455.1/~~gb/GECH01006455.1/.p1  ORF type:complete len:305 (+),score=90.19 gb/GECH01006455.1/:1-915(+)